MLGTACIAGEPLLRSELICTPVATCWGQSVLRVNHCCIPSLYLHYYSQQLLSVCWGPVLVVGKVLSVAMFCDSSASLFKCWCCAINRLCCLATPQLLSPSCLRTPNGERVRAGLEDGLFISTSACGTELVALRLHCFW